MLSPSDGPVGGAPNPVAPEQSSMASQRCDGCTRRVRIGGGIGDFWTFSNQGSTDGMDLVLADGSEFFLCFDCIERLPDDRDATAADVEALPVHTDD